jgi:hypothetical protein
MEKIFDTQLLLQPFHLAIPHVTISATLLWYAVWLERVDDEEKGGQGSKVKGNGFRSTRGKVVV